MSYSLYIHIPFCKKRCHYCDFVTYAGMESHIPAYVDAIIKEIRIVTSYQRSLPIHTVYFGGGTPSLLSVNEFNRILQAVQERFFIVDPAEITIEANPGTIDLTYLRNLRAIGVNRLSIGVQSTNLFDLERLDRIHNVRDILESVRFARIAGFKNINLDLIFGLPWQSCKSWEFVLKRAMDLNPDHFSLYSLIIEPGTPLKQWYDHGLIQAQNQDLEAEMYQLALDLMGESGYQHYEISNWAKNSSTGTFQCQHNLQYWLNQPYLGIGAGAHGYANYYRTENTPQIKDYLARIGRENQFEGVFPSSPAAINVVSIDRETQMKEFMMLGFRLVQEGVSEKRFRDFFGKSMKKLFQIELNSLVQRGLIEPFGFDDCGFRLTKKGIFLANQVFMEFV